MKNWIKATNIVGMVSVILLIYWVFSFILITAFGLRVFKRSLTELFTFSVMGIIALMAAALMLNIMLNLTRIAEGRQSDEYPKSSRKIIYLGLSIFPILAALLFGGHHLTVQRKQQILVQSAITLVSEHAQQAQQLAQYRFDVAYINKTAEILDIWRKRNSAFSHVSVIVPEQINGETVWLAFDADAAVFDKMTRTIRPSQYLFTADLATNEYLQAAFQNDDGENIRFTENQGKYELFYPYSHQGKVLAIFRFADYQPYGKLGTY